MPTLRGRRALRSLARTSLVLVAMSACTSPSTSTSNSRLTLTIVNARVWTGDRHQPWAEAIGIRGDRVAAVGDTTHLAAHETERTIDAGGRLLVPGFIDSHVHFLAGGQRLASVQLRDVASREAFVAAIGAYAKTVPPGTWITGGDWDHERWGGALPEAAWIDSVTPNNPVWVNRLDGHMALANGAALAAAGVTKRTVEIPGGTIVRSGSGEPTGVLKDNAMALVDRHVPPAAPETLDRALDTAMRYVAERGVTSVHHMGTWDDLEVFERAAKKHALRTRIYAAVPLSTWPRLRDVIRSGEFGGNGGRGDDWLSIGALKGFVDGSLGSHTAAFFEPFSDAPQDRGLFVNPLETMKDWIVGADAAGLHVVVHAIGDRANHELLNIYQQAIAANGPRDRRFRIEHAQHLAPRDIPRFRELSVLPSMQPYHAIDDGRWAEKVIGAERSRTTYAFRSLKEAGAMMAFGSDWFVAPPTPIEGIYAAVTRRTLDDRHPGGWIPDQKIDVETALRAYTEGAAFAEFAEARKGRLAPGFLADLVILDRDLFAIPPETIRDARVTTTVVGGRVVYER
jgi:predicted amidohydrolase YtcJ